MSRAGSTRPPVTLLGFDFGVKRIGVAVGQAVTGSVSPLTTLKAVKDKPDWQAISQLIDEWQPDLLIVGLPLSMDGSETHATPLAIRFGHQLKGRYNLPVEMVDERLTSVEARRELYEGGTRKRVQREDIDQLAAQYIIEDWLTQQQEHH